MHHLTSAHLRLMLPREVSVLFRLTRVDVERISDRHVSLALHLHLVKALLNISCIDRATHSRHRCAQTQIMFRSYPAERRVGVTPYEVQKTEHFRDI